MKAILKWTALTITGLVGILVVAITASYLLGNSRLYNVQVTSRPVASNGDAAALARGEHLVNSVTVCIDCHGPNLEGKPFFDEPAIGFISAPNLTTGAGGVGASYTEEDWERAIRHGVGADGRALGAMPSDSYAHLSDEDVAAIIAYLKTVPAVDNDLPERSLSAIATLIFGVLDYNNLPLAKIDHQAVGAGVPVESVSVEYGRYLVDIAVCKDCHGPNLEGRSAQDAETGPPAGPNLTPGGALGSWTEQDLAAALRSGSTPDGRRLNLEMPWASYSGMSDDEIRAIWLYLQSLPASP
jgi:mono/diheme cytochrome c family protein